MRLLVADDNEMSLRRVCSMATRWGFEAVPVLDGLSAWAMLEADPTLRIAILDLQMPGLSGIAICRRARASRSNLYRFLMLLTGSHEQDSLIQGLQAGADDFLRKPFDATELELRLRNGARIIELQDGLLKSQNELWLQANTDALTGIYNRRAIVSELESSLEQVQANGSDCGLMMIDVDEFKAVNDLYGHLTGDLALQHVAEIINSCTLSSTVNGRFGGEEFLIVCPGLSPTATSSLANAIRHSIAALPIAIETTTLNITVSIGVSHLDRLTSNIQAAVKRCDDALYSAKRAGRNCVRTSLGPSVHPHPSYRDASPESNPLTIS